MLFFNLIVIRSHNLLLHELIQVVKNVELIKKFRFPINKDANALKTNITNTNRKNFFWNLSYATTHVTCN
jgi:hypothetical protein